ncbi:MAG: anthranilate synthase component I family protein, partial [Flavisolibacter sp.]
MKKINIQTKVKRLLADVYTPVGIYLRLRDRYRDTILLESTDHHAAENSYSFICINAIAGIEVRDRNVLEFKLPAQPPEKMVLKDKEDLAVVLWDFMQRFHMQAEDPAGARFAQGLYGYFTFDLIPLIEQISFTSKASEDQEETAVPPARYRLYQYVIAINHHKDELILCENQVANLESEIGVVESLISSKDVPVYPFRLNGEETSNLTDEDFMKIVQKGMDACFRGDVFQIVLSRRYRQAYKGDEFNVYRTLRNINPSPYLFFFDYGDYKIMGSSPEAQLIIANGKATVHPIAGTFKRTGDDLQDQQKAEELKNDPKENAEHVMLVDLARNDLSRVCEDVEVSHYREVQYYSHVIHLVSEVNGRL